MFNPQANLETCEQTHTGLRLPCKCDRLFMQQALALAAKGQGYTSPNPAVGAVIVRNRQVVGAGYHQKAGQSHAEVEALRSAGDKAHGATLYVTLEPCSHHGRTPPCTQAIIAAGVREVVYAVADPNPLVSGKGHRKLVEAGLVVTQGVCAAQAQYLNRFFFHSVVHGRPYVVAKFAASLDGKIATRSGDSRWISGEASRQQAHWLRHLCDAVLIGADTAILDNPRLTTRLEGFLNPRQPIRILLDSRGRVPLGVNIFDPSLPGKTIVATTDAMPAGHAAALDRKGIEVLVLPAAPDGRVDPGPLLDALGRRELISLLIEGGGQVMASFVLRGLVNEVWAFLAPIILGGEAAPGPVRGCGVEKVVEGFHLEDACVEQVGHDFLIRGYAGRMPGASETHQRNSWKGKR
ncbi:MAG: bifunctional diaminohydroxyphosphoribosylaminopyrimidine deaminase/5-amino-6-(5-phosphoribosylamino)uracil reductase RibD [Chloroflexota bacterium]